MNNVINIKLHSKEDYINKYNSERLNQDLIDYLVEEIKGISIKESIKINIITNFKMEEVDKEQLVNMLRSHFGTDVGELYDLNSKFAIIDFILAIIGILVLVSYFFLINVPILSEFLLIIGWLFIWEAVYNIIFERAKTKVKIKKLKKITNCKIEFNEYYKKNVI